MSAQKHQNMSMLLENRWKAEWEVKRIHQQQDQAVLNGNWRVRIERLVTSCTVGRAKTIKIDDQLLELTPKVDDFASPLKEEETWLNFMTTKNGMLICLRAAGKGIWKTSCLNLAWKTAELSPKVADWVQNR